MDESLQEIQKKRYPDYSEIENDIKCVNIYLMQYAKQLQEFIGMQTSKTETWTRKNSEDFDL